MGANVKYNLEGKVFRSVANTENGEVGGDTLFYYRQKGKLVSADYFGGTIVSGHLLAQILKNGQLDMRYHHLNNKGEFMLGKCLSTPELMADGRLKFKEAWQWLSGDMSSGYSEIEEVQDAQHCAPADPLPRSAELKRWA